MNRRPSANGFGAGPYLDLISARVGAAKAVKTLESISVNPCCIRLYKVPPEGLEPSTR